MGVSVRQQIRDGKWYLYVRHAGDRASQKYDTEDEANLVAHAVRNAIALGQFDIAALKKARERETEKSLPTLKEFYEKTVSPLWEALADTTFQRYTSSFDIHVLPQIGALPLNELSRDRVKTFVLSLVQKNSQKRTHGEEKQSKERDRRLSKDSIRNIVAALRGALNEAVERQLLASNPAVKLGKLYKEAGQVREEVDPITPEEIPLLLETTLTHFGFENYVLLLSFLHTGLRASEMAGLQWTDIDFRSRFVIVRRQFRNGAQRRTKTAKIRKVDVSDVLLRELQLLKKRRQEEYLGRGKNEIPEWVFLGPGQIIWEDGKQVGHTEGTALDMNNWRNRVYWKASEKAKIRRRRLHDTRHTFASILLMNGESPAYVKEQLGHSSITMTVDVYGHFIPGANRQAVNKLPSLTSQHQARAAAD